MTSLTALASAAVVAATASSVAVQNDLSGSISIAGSSTVGPITNAVIEQVQRVKCRR